MFQIIIPGDQIAPDEHLLPDLAFGFDGKRDRWNGYDPREHKRVVQEHLKLEEAKRLLKAQEMNESLVSPDDRWSAKGCLICWKTDLRWQTMVDEGVVRGVMVTGRMVTQSVKDEVTDETSHDETWTK